MSERSWRRPTRRSILAATTVLVAAALVGGGVAYAATQQPSIKTSTPRTANQMTNIDVLRQQIKNYYGDPLGTGVAASDSNYAKEARGVAKDGEHWPAWVRFNKRVGSSGDVGIWHETYLVPAGANESVYNNMPPTGLGQVGELVNASGRRATAAARARGEEPDYPAEARQGADL